MRPLKTLILGFIAGFLAVLIFHQSLWYVLNLVGLIPPDRPAWPLDPIPPYGVPSVISKAFWGGVWGAVLAPVLQNLRGLPIGGLGPRGFGGAHARRLFCGAADQGRADPGIVAALSCRSPGERRLGIRHRASSESAACGAPVGRVRVRLPTDALRLRQIASACFA